MIALPAGVFASGFSEQMRIRREEYREAVEKAMDDGGRLTARERRALEDTRHRLGLSEDEAIYVLEEAMRESRACPHCGLPIVHPVHERRRRAATPPVDPLAES